VDGSPRCDARRKKTVIIASGGVEANGPYLATGKHNYVLRATTEVIARKLGNALVAPIIPFVPEGSIEPPGGHMVFAGSITLSEETFERLVAEIAASMKVHGFDHIVLIADSGGNVVGMKKVAEELTAKWKGAPTVHYIVEYYDYPGVQKWLETQGIHETAEGIHDEFSITSVMMTVDPMLVRMPQRIAAGENSRSTAWRSHPPIKRSRWGSEWPITAPRLRSTRSTGCSARANNPADRGSRPLLRLQRRRLFG